MIISSRHFYEMRLCVFHNLFERFVRNFYRIHATTYVVKREHLSWHDELFSAFVPMMETDITLVERRAPYRRLIVDTKYSVTTLSDTKKFKSDNLYQIYAYLRTQEDLSEAHRNASGILLYPTTSHHFTESMRVQGHRITVATVDLANRWQQIETDLLALIDPVLHSAQLTQTAFTGSA